MWTDQDLDTLRQGAAAGLSGSQIAMKLHGRTRNAVIGKLHRLGLSTSGQAYIFWNEKRDAELQRLTDEGYSQAAAAEQIGCTRIAVRDRLARLRREGRSPPNLSTRYRKRIAKRPEKVTKRFSALTGLPLVGAPKPPPAPKFVAADANPRRLKFLDLQHDHCRFILDEHDVPGSVDSVYCGADTVKDGSWCEPHRRVVFQAR